MRRRIVLIALSIIVIAMTDPQLSALIAVWTVKNQWVDYYLAMCSDDVLRRELTPGGNTGVWILGHLIASDDDLSLYLGKGPRLFPEYEALFQDRGRPKPLDAYPSIEDLRRRWTEVCAKNAAILASMNDAELDEPHAMGTDDPNDDYFTNKRDCIANWAAHQLYHVGQLGAIVSAAKRERENADAD